MGLFQKLFGTEKAPGLQNLLEKGAFLVDVREPAEFGAGSVKGAVNIPLGLIAARLDKFKGKENIIVFCRSGVRSGQAKTTLEKNGFNNVVNGGSWENVKQFVK